MTPIRYLFRKQIQIWKEISHKNKIMVAYAQ